MKAKTNAIRLLEIHKIDFKIQEYEVDEEDLSVEHLAKELNINADRIFKTLVLVSHEKEYFVAVVPGSYQLNLKKMAKLIPTKSCELIPVKELLGLTGYIRGGCSPIGMKKQLPTWIEESAQLFETIYVNAGKRGLLVEIDPDELKDLVQAVYADLLD